MVSSARILAAQNSQVLVQITQVTEGVPLLNADGDQENDSGGEPVWEVFPGSYQVSARYFKDPRYEVITRNYKPAEYALGYDFPTGLDNNIIVNTPAEYEMIIIISDIAGRMYIPATPDIVITGMQDFPDTPSHMLDLLQSLIH